MDTILQTAILEEMKMANEIGRAILRRVGAILDRLPETEKKPLSLADRRRASKKRATAAYRASLAAQKLKG